MLNKLQKRKDSGFTIIEVMIVLAIAALILLVVLLAVPALQRSSRNTTLKSDASAVAGGINEFESNNGGSVPGNTGSINSSGTVTFGSGSQATATAKVQGGDTVTGLAYANAPTTAPAAGVIDVVYGAKCVDTTGFTVTSSTRSTAIIYSVEGGGSSLSAQCLSS